MTNFDLTGRRALVTGAAQGLGEGMARALADAGATVVIADVKDELGGAVAQSLGDGHAFVHLDVTDDAAWEIGDRPTPSKRSAGSTSSSTTPGSRSRA